MLHVYALMKPLLWHIVSVLSMLWKSLHWVRSKTAVLTAGKQRRWDMISSHSSLAVIIYHTARDALLVVRQFRPPVSALPCPVTHTICESSIGVHTNDRDVTPSHTT